MSFSAAVASGQRAIDTLQTSCATGVESGQITLRRHEDLAVAWSTSCQWIDTSDDGMVLVVVDGRLHNLWSETVGQAELVRQRYRARGTDVARGLLGDFVLIILDRRRRTLLVARDPVGVRPWYRASAGRSHAGASDLASLAALPWVDTSVNEPLAIEYLSAIEESRGGTLIRGVQTLPPGHTWEVGSLGSRTTVHHRWDVRPDLGISWDDAAERCRTVLEEAVRCRLRVSGSPTSELSGGLDSSSVVGTLVRLGRDDLLVGRMLFDAPGADERVYSDAVIHQWGLKALSVPPWIPTPAELIALTRALRRPVPDPNFTMFVSLHRAMRTAGRCDGLTGLGGDDAFLAMGIGSRVVSAVQLRQATVLRTLARQARTDPRRSWFDVVRPTLGHVARRWREGWSPQWVTQAAKERAGLRQLASRRPEPVTGVSAIDLRLSSLTSGYDASILEARALVTGVSGTRESHPFLDPRLVMATYGLNPWWPTRGGHDRALEVDAFRDRLPAVVAQRRWKAEFSEVFWPQLLHSNVVAAVRSGPLRDLGWLDLQGFDALVERATKGMANAAIPFSRCVSVDQWLRAG